MKVGELIEFLENFDSEMEVGFAYNYGDYWRTQVVADIDQGEEGYVKYSEYHSMNAIASEDEIAEAEYLEAYPEENKLLKEKQIKRMVILT
jgi:hypothetical protein